MLVSVIIPAYRAQGFLAAAVDSVLRQRRPADEIIIVENHSPDDTLAAAHELAGRHRGLVRVLCEPKPGAAAARQRGLREARGEWIAFLDADDRWLPDKLAVQLDCAADDREAAMIQVRNWLVPVRGPKRVNPDYVPTPQRWCEDFAARRFSTNPSAMMVRRDVLRKVGGFDTSLLVGEDTDLWLRISSGHRAVCVAEPLAETARGHEDSTLMRAGMLRTYQTDLRVWRKNRGLLAGCPSRRRAWRRGYAVLHQLIALEQARRGAWGRGAVSMLTGCVIDPRSAGSPAGRQFIERAIGSRTWEALRRCLRRGA